jgi:hypothetical protein
MLQLFPMVNFAPSPTRRMVLQHQVIANMIHFYGVFFSHLSRCRPKLSAFRWRQRHFPTKQRPAKPRICLGLAVGDCHLPWQPYFLWMKQVNATTYPLAVMPPLNRTHVRDNKIGKSKCHHPNKQHVFKCSTSVISLSVQ